MQVVDEYDRPATRGDCENMPRPCPFVSCSHHLYLDVNPAGKTLKIRFPGEVEDMHETCALDVADRGGLTLEDVGKLMSLTRERVRQIEDMALRKLREQRRTDS